MIKILDNSLKRLGVIKRAYQATRLEEINGENTLDFQAVLDSKLTNLISDDAIFELDDDYFDAAFLKKIANEDNTYMIEVESDHISYRLNKPDYNVEYFAETGTPTYILGKILDGTGFTIGTVEYANQVTYSAQEKKSRRQLLMEFVATLGGEVKFNKFSVSILIHRGSTVTKAVLKDRNVKVVSKSINKRELDQNGNPKVSYACESLYLPDDSDSVNNDNSYSLGDDVILIQKNLGIKEQLRVVRISYNPYNNAEVSFEFSNYTDGLANEVYNIATSAVVKDALYNGARIGPEYGFESVRNDKKARAYFRSDEMKFQSGDGTGNNWKDRLYFTYDTEKNETVLMFDGILSANVIQALQEIIVGGGGNVDLGSGQEIYDYETNPTIHITKDLIDVLDGKIRIRDHSGKSIILNQYGIDTNFVKNFKNYVYNSQFEIYDKNKRPYYWSAGEVSKEENFFGTVSLKLTSGQSSQIQNYEINPQDYSEITSTRISFYRKGSVKVEVLDEFGNPYTLKDNDGNSGVSLTAPDQFSWLNSRYTFNFIHGEHKNCIIKFTNVGDLDCFIDAVQLEPDFTGMWSSFYTDGPESFGDGSGDKVTKVSKYSARNPAAHLINSADIDMAQLLIDFKENSKVEITCTCTLQTSNITELKGRHVLWDDISSIEGAYTNYIMTELYPGWWMCTYTETINSITGIYHLTEQITTPSGTGTVAQNDFLMEVTVYEDGGTENGGLDIKELKLYADGMIVTNKNLYSTTYNFEKDTNGRITQISNADTNTTMAIIWNSGNIPTE